MPVLLKAVIQPPPSSWGSWPSVAAASKKQQHSHLILLLCRHNCQYYKKMPKKQKSAEKLTRNMKKSTDKILKPSSTSVYREGFSLLIFHLLRHRRFLRLLSQLSFWISLFLVQSKLLYIQKNLTWYILLRSSTIIQLRQASLLLTSYYILIEIILEVYSFFSPFAFSLSTFPPSLLQSFIVCELW